MVANRTVTIRPVSPAGLPAVTFGLLNDATYQNAIGGTGGVQIVDIPRQPAVTQWYDRSPYELDLSLRIDSSIVGQPNTSVELSCMTVESWQDRAAGTNQIPVLSLTGPVPGVQRQWFVYTLAFGKAIRDAQAGFRTQQDVDITLYEYVPPSTVVLNEPTPAAAAAQALSAVAATTSYSLYTVVAGDTLSTIAAKLLGNYTQWTVLATLNSIRDPNSLTPGQLLLVPQQT